MGLIELGMLLALGAIWGSSFLFIRLGAIALGPFLLADIRVLLAGVSLLLYSLAIGRKLGLRKHWRQYLVLGGINSALPFALIGAAELQLPASMAAILNATTPLFSAVVSALWLGEAFTVKKGLGLVAGFTGVVALMGWSPVEPGWPTYLAAGYSLLAALSYAVGTAYASRTFRGTAPLALSTGQQLGAGVLLLPFAGATLPSTLPSGGVVAAVVTLALLCTSVAYLIYFRLLQRVGPTRTLSVTFLVPGFGLLWGALFLGEAITAGVLAGLALIFVSVILVTGVRLPSSRPQTGESQRAG